MTYSTIQQVREDTRLLVKEERTGIIGTSLSTDHKFWLTATGAINYVYVNGTTIGVGASSSPAPGKYWAAMPNQITFGTALQASDIIILSFNSNEVDDAFITELITESDGRINDLLTGLYTTPFNPVPETITRLSRLYASVLLLNRTHVGKEPNVAPLRDEYLSEFNSVIDDLQSGRKTLTIAGVKVAKSPSIMSTTDGEYPVFDMGPDYTQGQNFVPNDYDEM